MAELSAKQKSGAAIAAAVLIAAPLTASFEGLRTHPYRDPGNPNLMTVCYGETERAMRVYTGAECQTLLRQREAENYAPAVLKCAPNLGTRRYAFAASVDASYNAGIHAFCRSPMAARFNRGDWAGGCNAFRGWYVSANGRVLPGLVRRREAEAATCLKGLAA